MSEKYIIKPTQGCYQHDLKCEFVRETKTLIIVRPEHESYDWKFSKSNLLRLGSLRNDFPRYKLEINNG